eukprot:scaffold1123_cov168-Amphora_coffeaeformis.AAC.8
MKNESSSSSDPLKESADTPCGGRNVGRSRQLRNPVDKPGRKKRNASDRIADYLVERTYMTTPGSVLSL